MNGVYLFCPCIINEPDSSSFGLFATDCFVNAMAFENGCSYRMLAACDKYFRNCKKELYPGRLILCGNPVVADWFEPIVLHTDKNLTIFNYALAFFISPFF